MAFFSDIIINKKIETTSELAVLLAKRIIKMFDNSKNTRKAVKHIHVPNEFEDSRFFKKTVYSVINSFVPMTDLKASMIASVAGRLSAKYLDRNGFDYYSLKQVESSDSVKVAIEAANRYTRVLEKWVKSAFKVTNTSDLASNTISTSIKDIIESNTLYRGSIKMMSNIKIMETQVIATPSMKLNDLIYNRNKVVSEVYEKIILKDENAVVSKQTYKSAKLNTFSPSIELEIGTALEPILLYEPTSKTIKPLRGMLQLLCNSNVVINAKREMILSIINESISNKYLGTTARLTRTYGPVSVKSADMVFEVYVLATEELGKFSHQIISVSPSSIPASNFRVVPNENPNWLLDAVRQAVSKRKVSYISNMERISIVHLAGANCLSVRVKPGLTINMVKLSLTSSELISDSLSRAEVVTDKLSAEERKVVKKAKGNDTTFEKLLTKSCKKPITIVDVLTCTYLDVETEQELKRQSIVAKSVIGTAGFVSCSMIKTTIDLALKAYPEAEEEREPVSKGRSSLYTLFDAAYDTDSEEGTAEEAEHEIFSSAVLSDYRYLTSNATIAETIIMAATDSLRLLFRSSLVSKVIVARLLLDSFSAPMALAIAFILSKE
jgi:hypothetical protein